MVGVMSRIGLVDFVVVSVVWCRWTWLGYFNGKLMHCLLWMELASMCISKHTVNTWLWAHDCMCIHPLLLAFSASTSRSMLFSSAEGCACQSWPSCIWSRHLKVLGAQHTLLDVSDVSKDGTEVPILHWCITESPDQQQHSFFWTVKGAAKESAHQLALVCEKSHTSTVGRNFY